MLRSFTIGEQKLLSEALRFQAQTTELNGLANINLSLFENEEQAINEDARKALSGLITAHINKINTLRTLAELVDRYELIIDIPVELPELA